MATKPRLRYRPRTRQPAAPIKTIRTNPTPTPDAEELYGRRFDRQPILLERRTRGF
jgi:hypothetical protein